ncbi:micrococcal nuclease [Malassezia vespertilionis]|uniref:TNase-like domain-containing protein n=1 Tax=Malassezia vespertilionis TaxID=2020962 RepID=A0A2N1JAG9_9BASI|nr:micrococcal nuclease [Malassezia vespertilionis]PKI83556.1 hypothetical protein MVES_002478 [Malassezia vespertilionis]WFD07264.1 micrococcal nuclease [Malassezia vespertilionis]
MAEGAMQRWYVELARWAELHEAELCVERERLQRRCVFSIDIPHFAYLLQRCDALGLPVGDLDPDVQLEHALASEVPVSTIQDKLRGMFSLQDSVDTLSILWGTMPLPSDDPDAPFRTLYRILTQVRALELYPSSSIHTHAVSLHACKSLTELTLRGVRPEMVHGWDRLCVQLCALECSGVDIPDITDIFTTLVSRELPHAEALPAAAWHSLRYANLSRNALTFVPESALKHVPGLVHLDISHNLLSAVPPALELLPNLRALNVADNMVDSVHGIYHTLKAIRTLNLAHNRLESVCGVERLATLEQADLRGNQIWDTGEIGRLAQLPHCTHVWIEENPLMYTVQNARVACFALFALEHKEVVLDDAPAGFFERRHVAERLAKRVAMAPQRHHADAKMATEVRHTALHAKQPSPEMPKPRRARPRRTDPGPRAGTEDKALRRSRPSELPGVPEAQKAADMPSMPRAPFKQRIEKLRNSAGDDWLRQLARGELQDEPAYPIQAPNEDAPSGVWAVIGGILSTPIGAALTSVAVATGATYVWWRYLRRIPNTGYLTPAVLKTHTTLVGKVTSVGDADGFRVYHTPGLPILRTLFHRVPSKPSALRDQTISVRIAGADAPEAAHFGRAAQPFAAEAKEELKRLVDGRMVTLDVAHIDQYRRLVAIPYVWHPPYIFGRTNVSLTMVRKGLATVYRNAGAAYGQAGFFSRYILHSRSGLRSLERAEEIMRLGMWSLGRKLETPAEYKRRNADR